MKKGSYIVNVAWDEETKVWCAAGINFPGLAADARTIDALFKKVKLMVADLIEAGEELSAEEEEIPVNLMVEGSIITHKHCA